MDYGSEKIGAEPECDCFPCTDTYYADVRSPTAPGAHAQPATPRAFVGPRSPFPVGSAALGGPPFPPDSGLPAIPTCYWFAPWTPTDDASGVIESLVIVCVNGR